MLLFCFFTVVFEGSVFGNTGLVEAGFYVSKLVRLNETKFYFYLLLSLSCKQSGLRGSFVDYMTLVTVMPPKLGIVPEPRGVRDTDLLWDLSASFPKLGCLLRV
jgi:hypothetical protein